MKKDKAYMFIKRKILNRTWDVGSAININEVSATLNMSRTPVQEATSRLEREGLLSIIPQVGVFVRRPNTGELYERLLVRGALEALTAEWAAQKASQEQLDEMEIILQQMDDPNIPSEKYSKLNKDFHQLIHLASGLSYVVEKLQEDWNFFEYAANTKALFKENGTQQSYLEHRMIFSSLKNKDGAFAKQLMTQHVLRVANLYEKNKRNGAEEKNEQRKLSI